MTTEVGTLASTSSAWPRSADDVFAIRAWTPGRAASGHGADGFRGGDSGTSNGCSPAQATVRESPAEGVATSTHLASSPGLERVTGCSFADGMRKRSSGRTYGEATAERLWRVSAGLVGLASIA